MTDNEIIKALECCCDTTEIDCSEECPLYNHSGECWGAMKYDVFDLINRQKAQIERLNNKYINLLSKIEHLTGV